MKDIYPLAGLTKQAFFKSMQREVVKEQISKQVLSAFTQIRVDHKRMSCRKMYYVPGVKLPVGRDIAEQIGFANGFKIKVKRNPQKTTWGQRVEVYPNLIDGLIINNINQVWQSDIFYLNVQGRPYYGIGIIDVYSRYLLALHISKSLRAEENVKALLKAISKRGKEAVKGCIFHSDRGSQYISEKQKTILIDHEMQISMCKLPQENAYAERLNGILKNDYFYTQKLTPENVMRYAARVQNLYNNQRPHEELNNLTPTQFEQQIAKMVENQRPKLQIYQWTPSLSTEYQVINKEKSSKKEILPNT